MSCEMKAAPVPMGETCPPPMEVSLTELMRNTSIVAADVLTMAERLNNHLFSLGNNIHGEKTEPKCFADELALTHQLLVATAEELSQMSVKLGL